MGWSLTKMAYQSPETVTETNLVTVKLNWKTSKEVITTFLS